ncbi:hypothetical protein EFA46_010715 (plasmid) [Halarchaeum sp. CBA1220]|uniref:hypothetical protein n=1 Tax=Halarchaeum sp. CBA1220 TaxID=1853682 RepID=UPI000F3AA816|nr:hypothetical protein [Halarchaeum sp. CBA1220]QLC34733.1 hypothetical protein EFA46_010715 [Halarchaeum sp. CBA1220]
MSSVQETRDSASPLDRSVLRTVRHSVLLLLAVVGLVEILLGYAINTGPWAAIVAVWGAGLVVVGVVGHTFVWWKRQ